MRLKKEYVELGKLAKTKNCQTANKKFWNLLKINGDGGNHSLKTNSKFYVGLSLINYCFNAYFEGCSKNVVEHIKYLEKQTYYFGLL